MFQVCSSGKFDRGNFWFFLLSMIPAFIMLFSGLILENFNYKKVKELNQGRPDRWEIQMKSVIYVSVLVAISVATFPALLSQSDEFIFCFVMVIVFIENAAVPYFQIYLMTKEEFRVGRQANDIGGNEMIEMNDL